MNDNRMIRIMVFEPGRAPYTTMLEDSLEHRQELVGGDIECIPLPCETVLCCNASGKLTGLPENRILDQYAGHSAAKTDAWKQPWQLKRDGGSAEYISGATISSRAVNELAWKAASVFEAHRAELVGTEGDKK